MERRKFFTIFIAISILVLGCFVSYQIASYQAEAKIKKIVATIVPVRENNFNYKYIYPLLTYNLSQALPYLENHTLSSKINDYIQTQYQQKNAKVIGVYYRNLLTNEWAGTNEDVQFHPGSMMKVIIMMAYYRESQLDSTVMQKQFNYSGTVNEILATQHFATPTALVIGQNYNVKDLIKKMIEDSDNGAETLLLYNVNNQILNDAYRDLSLKTPGDTNSNYTISAKQYSAFLRVLYNSTYLTELNSEEALNIMSQSTYHDGIYAAIPNNILVAEKYGEYVDSTASGSVDSLELHNCGIVYAKSPFVMCVMTKGSDEKTLASIIKNIAGMVYTNVSN